MKQRERYRNETALASRKEKKGADARNGVRSLKTPTSLINVYMRSMHAMPNRALAEVACTNADVVIRPILADSVWYDFYNPERLHSLRGRGGAGALPLLKGLVGR